MEIKGLNLKPRVTYIVNSVFSSRSYFLSNGSEAWLVDCGDVLSVIDHLTSENGVLSQIKGVLLTHVHYDHIYGLPRMLESYPWLKIYTNNWGRETLADERKNMSRYHEDPINLVSDNVIVCGEGDVIDLFDGISARVYSTPGHNPSCLCYQIGDYLFTGDAFIPGIDVVTTLPGADKELAKNSEERIKMLAAGKIVCPGHELNKELPVGKIYDRL